MKSKVLLILSLSTSVLIGGVSPTLAATVTCGARRHAVVRPVRLRNGQRVDRVVCVSRHASVVRRAPHRSWKKSALVIGGSTAAGAGVGALVGGGKGAIIGGVAG